MSYCPIYIELENTAGRKQQLRAWNFHDDRSYYVTNISASRINRRTLEEILETWQNPDGGYAQLEAWEYVAKMMPGWNISVFTKDADQLIWNNQDAGRLEERKV